MKHGSLFSGIGGFDLAVEWMGWENVFHCEWNEFGQRVLKYYWPKAESFNDITKSDFTKYYGKIDILTGGFPCQPYSSAGKRKGKDDERHLWPQMLRAIREISPRFVVGENVRGLTNWNGGMVFEEVCAELEAIGYQVAPVIIPACSVGAPHRRERVWFVAKNTMRAGCLQREFKQKGAEVWEQRNISAGSADGIYLSEGITSNTDGAEQRNNSRANNRKAKEIWRENQGHVFREFCSNGNVTNTERGGGLQRSENLQSEQPNGIEFFSDGRKWDATNTTNIRRKKALENRELERGRFRIAYKRNIWDSFPSQSPICGGNDGLSSGLDGITFSKWQSESIKGYGNAIVPQVAYQIFKAIVNCDDSCDDKNRVFIERVTM
jgi:DNA (cytosine-5)-methyltransferase 1